MESCGRARDLFLTVGFFRRCVLTILTNSSSAHRRPSLACSFLFQLKVKYRTVRMLLLALMRACAALTEHC